MEVAEFRVTVERDGLCFDNIMVWLCALGYQGLPYQLMHFA